MHIFCCWFIRWDKTRSNSSGFCFFIFIFKIGRKRVIGSLDHHFFFWFRPYQTRAQLFHFRAPETQRQAPTAAAIRSFVLQYNVVVNCWFRHSHRLAPSSPFRFIWQKTHRGGEIFRDGNMWVFYLISLPLTLGMVIVTLKYFAGPWVPRYVFLTVGYTWFCSLSIIILVPADIWMVCFLSFPVDWINLLLLFLLNWPQFG